MNKINVPLETIHHPPPSRLAWWFLLLLGMSAGGCGTPPSVVPVLAVVQQALLDEAQRVGETDAARDQLYLQHARRQLWDGYRADLETTDTLTPDWIEDATAGFVAAREALLRQELDLARQRQTRQDNLRDAAAAQARAIAILQQRDRLIDETVGFKSRPLPPTTPETLR